MDRATTALAATLILLFSSGCGSLFGQKQLEQCRGESERLLVEYRAERDARQRTEIEKRALFDRVAELEKRLAAIDGTAGSWAPSGAASAITDRRAQPIISRSIRS